MTFLQPRTQAPPGQARPPTDTHRVGRDNTTPHQSSKSGRGTGDMPSLTSASGWIPLLQDDPLSIQA